MRTVSGERVQGSIMGQDLGVLASELSRPHVKLASNAFLTTSKKEGYTYYIEPLERKEAKGGNTHYIHKQSFNSILCFLLRGRLDALWPRMHGIII